MRASLPRGQEHYRGIGAGRAGDAVAVWNLAHCRGAHRRGSGLFCPTGAPAAKADLVFVGSMDWLPNIDGIQWFVEEVLPLIRKRRPDCSLVIAGRRPTPDIQRLAERDSRIRVTGTVEDIRPYLWESAVSIVPLRIGGERG